MATKNYTTKTAALRATTIDGRKIAVSKKIEIGGSSNKTTVSDTEISADVLKINAPQYNEQGELSYVRTDILDVIKNAQDSAAISVGRDADKNWSVDETAIGMVKKLSFLGDYVNVVEGSDGEVKLYIGENKSLEEADRQNLDVTLPGTSSVLLYTDATDNYALKSGVTANSTKTAAVVYAANAGYSSTTFTAKNGDSFTADQTDCIWVRTTYDYGEASAWGKVCLTKNRGDYNRNTTTPTDSSVTVAAVTVDTTIGEQALPTGVTMNVGNYILTAEADAQYGKVPGRCETAYDFTVNWNTIATKGGGNIKVEWGFGAADSAGTAPAAGVTIKAYERYFTEKKNVAMADSVSASVTTPSYTSAVSGLTYLGTGTTVTVTTPNITDSQYKTADSTKRLNVSAAGTSVDYTTGDLTLVSGTETASDAVYKLDGSSKKSNVIALGSTGNGSAAISATPHGAAKGTTRNATAIANFWGTIPTSTATVEKFGNEGTYRMITPTGAAGSYPSTTAVNHADVITSIPGTSYTNLVQAVCQYGELKHPSKASAQGDGTRPYSGITDDAVFIRKFQPSSDQKLTLSGSNLSSAKAVYWYDGATYNLISTPVTGVYTNSNDTITVTWNSSLHQKIVTGSPTVTIIIVMSKDTPNIGQLTLS